MQCNEKLLAELKLLVTKKHPWRLNNLRTNLARTPEDVVVDGTWRKLRKGVYNNGVRGGQSPAGDRMLAIVREMLPHATENALQLDRNVVCGRHKDARNNAAESHTLFLGHYTGGALVQLRDRPAFRGERRVARAHAEPGLLPLERGDPPRSLGLTSRSVSTRSWRVPMKAAGSCSGARRHASPARGKPFAACSTAASAGTINGKPQSSLERRVPSYL